MFRSLFTVGAFTFLSRILGFARDLVLAHAFGAGAATDAFFVAFKIPNFFRRLFAEGAFATAFVPVLSEYKEKRAFEDLKRFVDHIAGALGGVLLAITIIGVLFAPFIIMIFAPGFIGDDEKQLLASDMLRLTFPYLLFISLTAFCGAILNTYGKFGPPAFSPVLLNVCLITAALWLAPQMERPVVALAWGVFIAGVVQLLFQLPFLAHLRLIPRFSIDRKDEGVKRVMWLMVPALFGVSVTQLNLLLDTLLASFLETGSISWLYYSDRLMEFPLGVLGVALGTVILPNLSAKHASESKEGFSKTLDWALRWVLFLGLPSAVGLFVLAGPIIATLFQSDLFLPRDVEMATRSLMAYSIGLLAFIAIKVLAPGYFARQDTKTPVKIAIKAMSVNMVLNLILIFPLAHAGLALATTLSSSLNAWLLYRGLRQEGIYQPAPGWWKLILRALLACTAMAACLWWLAGDLSAWTSMARIDKILNLLGLILGGGLVYLGLLFAMGFRPSWILKAS
jgi:putative peptidoglycan lipid II flippase